MKAIPQFIQRHLLIVYFILAYSVWVLTPLIAISPMYGIPGLFAPALAAIIVSSISGGGQVRMLAGKLTIWRVNIAFYVVALGLPVLLSFFVAVLAWVFGGGDFHPAPITPLAAIIFLLVVGEELGWRGYAQPNLEKFPPLIAAIILGVIWGFWHLPNFFIPSLPHYEVPMPAFLLYTTSLSIIAAWLLKYTKGSVLIATLLHGSTNTFGFLTPGIDTATRWWIIAGVYSLAALIVAMIFGVRLSLSSSNEALSHLTSGRVRQ